MEFHLAPQYSFKNRPLLSQSEKAGCYWCCNVFDTKDITEYTDKDKKGVGQTALCPKCGIDSVLSMDSVSLEDLKKIQEYFQMH